MLASLLVCAMFHAACASAPVQLPPPPAGSVRDSIRTVAVVSGAAPIDIPAVPPSGLGRAAAAGAQFGIRPGAFNPSAAPAALIMVPAGALIGVAVYAARRPSDAELAASSVALKRLFDGFDVQEHLRAQVVRFARDHARRPALALTTPPASGREDGMPDGRSEAVDVDALLQVVADRVVLEQVWDFASDVGLVLVARARLIGGRDRRELYATSLTYRAGARPLIEWTADDCRALRAQILGATEALAERIVHEVFLVEEVQR